jgi:hypothetical protein
LGQGVLVTNACCGEFTAILPGSRNTNVVHNDGRDSEFAVVVEGTGGENMEGTVIDHNRGVVVIEGEEVTTHRRRPARSAAVKHPFL